jgi:hypothetical protein
MWLQPATFIGHRVENDQTIAKKLIIYKSKTLNVSVKL